VSQPEQVSAQAEFARDLTALLHRLIDDPQLAVEPQASQAVQIVLDTAAGLLTLAVESPLQAGKRESWRQRLVQIAAEIRVLAVSDACTGPRQRRGL